MLMLVGLLVVAVVIIMLDRLACPTTCVWFVSELRANEKLRGSLLRNRNMNHGRHHLGAIAMHCRRGLASKSRDHICDLLGLLF